MKEETSVVLVVDDKENMLRLMSKVLGGLAYVVTANDGVKAVEVLESQRVDVVLSDLRMPGLSGLEVLAATRRIQPAAQFVLMTAHATVGTAVEALRMGAYDYLTKPVDPDDVVQVVSRALGMARPAGPAGAPGDELLPGVLGRSTPMRSLGELVRRFADSTLTTVVIGETGTGKERVARAIHELSSRSKARFVAVNCAAIPSELLESELFGHAKGSFTGAARDRPGLFEDANGGTLFLDEIGELRLSMQAKLTRALEEGAIRRVGESRERSVDTRVVAATHRDLAAMVQNGSFREDLWYRLNVALVTVPPLRDRPTDIELLATKFLRETAGTLPSRAVIGFTPAAMAAMESYEWPGNVRQLKAAVERACVVALSERIDTSDLPQEVLLRGVDSRDAAVRADMTWSEATTHGREVVARTYLESVLRKFEGDVADAAAHASVERESFYRLLRRYSIDPDRFR